MQKATGGNKVGTDRVGEALSFKGDAKRVALFPPFSICLAKQQIPMVIEDRRKVRVS